MQISTVATVSRFVAVLCGFSYLVGAILLGGAASLSGGPTDGHYYLSSHGKLTEVSEAVYSYSRYHALVTIALVIIALGLSMKSKPTQRELLISRYVGAVLVASGLLLGWWWNRG